MDNNAILAVDIGTTKTIAIIATNDLTNRINILGVGNCKSEGINKGSIIDVNLASQTIQEAINTAIQSTNIKISSTYVSISGTHTKSIVSSGAVNIQSGQITHNEIDQVLRMALHNANIIPEYETIHVLPQYFKIDDSNEINNPLDMHGSRLEVYVNIITAKKTALVNITNALKLSNLEVTNFILDSYASSVSLLENNQKKFGTAICNIGASTTEIAISKGQSIVYNDFIPIGSEHITNDLSIILHTPTNAANMIKKQYANLLPLDANNSSISKVKIPILGNESETKEIPLIQIQPIIHARIEELLILIKNKIQENEMLDYIDGGIILTGGMSQVKGIQQLAQKIFGNIPVKISNPINIENGYIDFHNPSMTTIAGLLKYALDTNPHLELDSNKNLRKKKKVEEVSLNNNSETTLHTITIDEEKPKKSFWSKIGEWL